MRQKRAWDCFRLNLALTRPPVRQVSGAQSLILADRANKLKPPGAEVGVILQILGLVAPFGTAKKDTQLLRLTH